MQQEVSIVYFGQQHTGTHFKGVVLIVPRYGQPVSEIQEYIEQVIRPQCIDDKVVIAVVTALGAQTLTPDLASFSAIDRAGFKVSLDAFGTSTLWCKECHRDTGYHFASCSKYDDNHELDALKRKHATMIEGIRLAMGCE